MQFLSVYANTMQPYFLHNDGNTPFTNTDTVGG